MSDLILRTPRATPLEYEDVDANFENINADKLQRTTNAGVTGTITTSATTSTITGLSSNNLAVGMLLVKTAGTGVLGTASTITAVDQFNDTITVAASSSHTSGSITFTASPVLNGAYIDAVSIGATTPGTGAFTTLSATGNATFDTNTLFVDASGNYVGIGTLAPTTKLTVSNNTVLPGTNASANALWLVGADSTANNVTIDSFGSNGAFVFRRSQGTSASPTALASGNLILFLGARGYGATGYSANSRATIQINAAENWTDTAQGAYTTFTTTQIGTTTNTERMRIDDAGNVGIGNTPSGTYRLEVTGQGYFSDNLTANKDLTVNGNTTLGNASGDTLTFQASTVALPNGLNFDSNTLVIDASNNRIGIGNASPGYPLDVSGTLNIAPSNTSGTQTGLRLYDAGTGAGEGLDILWESASRTSMCIINAIGDTTGGKLRFLTNGAASGNSTLALEVDENGYMYNYAGVANTRNSKSIVPGYLYYRLNGNFTGANATGAQSMFGVGVNLAANTIYEFEIAANFQRTGGGVAGHLFQTAIGGTRGVNNILYHVFVGGAITAVTNPDAAGNQISIASVGAATVSDNITAANSYIGMLIKGTISVSTTGTFIPQYALTSAQGLYTTIAGSYVKITPLGASGANINIGSWA